MVIIFAQKMHFGGVRNPMCPWNFQVDGSVHVASKDTRAYTPVPVIADALELGKRPKNVQ